MDLGTFENKIQFNHEQILMISVIICNPDLNRNLLKLPPRHHHTYHDLLRMAAVYVVVLCDVPRGGYSLAAMTKDMYREDSKSWHQVA